jgi:pilus assembly protein CpaB
LNPRVRTGLIIAIVGFFLIVLGIFAAIRFLNINLAANTAQTPPTPAAATKTLVALAANDVTAGTVLTAKDVTLAEVPIELAPRDTITNVDNAIGKISKTDLFQGEMILDHNLANPTGNAYDIAYVLDDKHVLMALPATDLMSRESLIKRGDIVDILVSYQTTLNTPSQTTATTGTNGATTGNTTNPGAQQVTFTAFQRLDITAIVVDIVQSSNTNPTGAAQQNASPRRDQTVVQAYLIALDPQNALVLKYLKDQGAIFDFVLRAPTSSGQFQLTPVTSQFIKELYGLDLLP